MKRKTQLIIFDLDGTLVNAYEAVAGSINFTMRELGLPQKSERLICRSVGWGDRHLIRKFVGNKAFTEAIAIYRKHHKQALPKGVRFLPGVKKVLRILKKQKYKLAIATNRPKLFTNIILRSLEMKEYFDYILCADQVGVGKPHSRILRWTLDKFSLLPRQALYVGDMTIDLEAGRRAQIKTIGVPTGSCTKKELLGLQPYRVIDKIEQLLDVLETITAFHNS